VSAIKKLQITNTKWFDKPFDTLTVLSKVEGLPTTLSQPVESLMVERAEGQITMTELLPYHDFRRLSRRELRTPEKRQSKF
jgi:hypothetical protein